MSETKTENIAKPKIGPVTRAFFWLSGAGEDLLRRCPRWEQRKYVAFGATVLVPTLFALISASYAVYTLTKNPFIIVTVALIWAYIILAVDRALLSTYRSSRSLVVRLPQFIMRVGVAVLMGMTISHPLALLLFKDTISAEIEAGRDAEILAVRADATKQKAIVEKRIDEVEKSIADQRQKINESFEAKFLDAKEGQDGAGVATVAGDTEAIKAEIEVTTAANRTRIEAIDAQLATESVAFRKVQEELGHWQTEFEKEVNGQRSGISGIGPRARSIQDDQLNWRRVEAKRLGTLVDQLTAERSTLATAVNNAANEVRQKFISAKEAQLAEAAKERERVAAIREGLQKEQAGQFAQQQVGVREALTQQINANLADLARQQAELKAISEDELARVNTIRNEPRADILTQTLAMHHLFEKGEEGGAFALAAYVVLALLFMVVDTIPIVVKFFSKPGPYDALVKISENRADKKAAEDPSEVSSIRQLVLDDEDMDESSEMQVFHKLAAESQVISRSISLLQNLRKQIEDERKAILQTEGDQSLRLEMLNLQERALMESFWRDLREKLNVQVADLPEYRPVPQPVIAERNPTVPPLTATPPPAARTPLPAPANGHRTPLPAPANGHRTPLPAPANGHRTPLPAPANGHRTPLPTGPVPPVQPMSPPVPAAPSTPFRQLTKGQLDPHTGRVKIQPPASAQQPPAQAPAESTASIEEAFGVPPARGMRPSTDRPEAPRPTKGHSHGHTNGSPVPAQPKNKVTMPQPLKALLESKLPLKPSGHTGSNLLPQAGNGIGVHGTNGNGAADHHAFPENVTHIPLSKSEVIIKPIRKPDSEEEEA